MGAPSVQPLSLQILNAYHSHISTLDVYLQDVIDAVSLPSLAIPSAPTSQFETILPTIREYLLQEGDEPAYVQLLTRSYIGRGHASESNAVDGTRDCRTRLKIVPAGLTMGELIDLAQARLFSKNKKPSNIITAGYRPGDLKAEGGGAGRPGITNFFVNTLVDALKAFEWETLLQRVGEAVMLHLVAETSIYLPLPNDCFCQLTGTPMIYKSPLRNEFSSNICGNLDKMKGEPSKKQGGKRKALDERKVADELSTKRQRQHTRQTAVSQRSCNNEQSWKVRRSPANIVLARTNLFYARPCKTAKSEDIILGFPTDHVLNRMLTEKWREDKGLKDEVVEGRPPRPADRDGAFEARHLAKYIFPRQYNLQNVFHMCPEEGRVEQFNGKCSLDRESEIELRGSHRTPKRLKNVVPLLSQLFHRHKACGYKALLNRLCPSKFRVEQRSSKIDTSVVLDLISEEPSELHIKTQADTGRSIISDVSSLSLLMGGDGLHEQEQNLKRPSLSSRSNAATKYKPKFAEFTCSYVEVFRFVRAVTYQVIPFEFWGSIENKKAVMQHVKQFIKGRRYENITLHSVIQNVKTSGCTWLYASENRGKSPYNRLQPQSDMLKTRELLEDFLFWYFDSFLTSLLRNTFYITESGAYRNRILYFRHDDWDLLCKPLIDRLVVTTFEKISQHEAEELVRYRKLGYSYVRLLPKESGVRPIVNLRRKRKADDLCKQNQSINQILAATFQILTHEKTVQEERLGASVFGPNEVYLRLKEFKKQIVDPSGNIPKLYFVKVDVQACFDTIEQEKLLGILKNIISEDVYMIQKFGQVSPALGKIKRRFVQKALPEYEHSHFLSYATRLAVLLRNTVIVDQVVYPFEFRDDILQLLEDHITSNIVKIGNNYYRQKVGIPQGSVLSSLLCSFFYGDLERGPLKFAATDACGKNVLLRLIDDYLFITPEFEQARRFLETMNNGHPEYGCFIARDKTLTNFFYDTASLSQLGVGCMLHPDQKLFPWCGYFINMKNLSVTTDYSRFHENYLVDSLTVERSRSPNVTFMEKMLQIATAKTHAIFIDTKHNSAHAARMNVHQAFVLTAMKMHTYIREASHASDAGGLVFVPGFSSASADPEGTKKSTDANERARGKFLLSVIRQCINLTHASIKCKVAGSVLIEAGGRCDITQNEVVWLGVHAFYRILARKRTVYSRSGVLFPLYERLACRRLRSERHRLGRLAQESLDSMLRDIKF